MNAVPLFDALNIWLITTGEPLPVEGARPLLRTGLLAQALADRGHVVTWWTGSFDHMTHEHWPQAQAPYLDVGVPGEGGYRIRFLQSPGYRRNVSLARLWDHRCAARDFERQARRRLADGDAMPDAIVCALPTLELAAAATAFGKLHGLPVALDVRDLWPDVFYTVAPPSLRPLAKALLSPYRRLAFQALSGASAVLACSSSYQKWGLAIAGRAAHSLDAVFPLGNTAPTALVFDDLPQALKPHVQAGVRLAVFAGVFGHSYDLETVVATARLLHNEGISQPLWVLAGDGEQAPRLRELAAGLPNVLFTGWVAAPQLAAVLAHAWVGVAAYGYEGRQRLPNKPFDYIGHGLPLFNSLQGELAELVAAQGIGWNLPPGNPAAWASCIQRLLANPSEHQAAAYRARQLFSHAYDTATVYPQYARWVEHLAEGRNNR